MTDQSIRTKTLPRALTCERCGNEFSCDLSGSCWCAEEAAKLPLPPATGIGFRDCLCRDCLCAVAVNQTASSDG